MWCGVVFLLQSSYCICRHFNDGTSGIYTFLTHYVIEMIIVTQYDVVLFCIVYYLNHSIFTPLNHNYVQQYVFNIIIIIMIIFVT